MDGGNLYLQRRRMQNAADAGALAGGRVLALNGTATQAQAAALEYAVTRNGAGSAQITVNSPSIDVRACTVTQMTFARVLGINQQTVCATAGGRFEPLAEAAGSAPIAILDFDYQFDQPYTIWDDTKESDPYSGNIQGSGRGWLCLTCVYPQDCGTCGTSELVPWMREGFGGTVTVGTYIRGDSGVKTPCIQYAMVGDLLTVVVYDRIEQKYPGKDYYHALKLAAFKVTQVYATGNPKGIRGEFQYYVTAGPPGTEDGGLRMIHLVQ
jgi:hypothetical protein